MSYGSIGGCVGEVIIGSLYGVSGCKVSRQLKLYYRTAARLMLLGRPFILGGDWQILPEELMGTGLPDFLDAEVCRPNQPTNLVSGREIDYFLVSKSLLAGGWSVETVHGCLFSPHVPVILRIKVGKVRTPVRRLARPRPLSPDRPAGPMPAGFSVRWEAWNVINDGGDDDGCEFDMQRATQATEEWFAGAECELLSVYGVARTDDETAHMGIGLPAREVQGSSMGRFRDVAEELGIVGQRLTWIARALAAFARHVQAARESGPDSWQMGTLSRLGHRGRAFLDDKRERWRRYHDAQVTDAIRNALKFIASWVRSVHRRPPILHALVNGPAIEDGQWIESAALHEARVVEALIGVAAERRRKQVTEVKRWAKAASLSAAHRATKDKTAGIGYSASANKAHAGERTPQIAADAGVVEWSGPWRARARDMGTEILEAIEAAEYVGECEPELQLQPIDGRRLRIGSRKFSGTTGVGGDWMRPRHIMWLTAAAREALAALLNYLERGKRWPDVLRHVIEVALTKKAGGARLIGLASSIYRLWARVRYLDVRAALELRIARPFLEAAPGRVAVRAVSGAAWATELAPTRGEHSATAIVDIKQYYEWLEPLEVAKGCKRWGVPSTIAALTLHLYSGPRRIRVDGCYSKPVYPTRSILAGCTWATVLIRVIVIEPVADFLRLVHERVDAWGIKVMMKVYVDDSALTLIGARSALAWLHPWACKLMMRWIRHVLCQQVAAGKAHCIVSSPGLKKEITRELEGEGIVVSLSGELLGMDVATGRQLRCRRVAASRRRKCIGRMAKLMWLKRWGGGRQAKHVARGGLKPTACYGAPVFGVNDVTLYTIRRAQAATCRVTCGGSSTTACLATGGENHGEADPAVLDANPPLMEVLARVWDQPAARQELVKLWRQAHDEVGAATLGRMWSKVRGAVGAALAHLRRIGAAWPKPFFIAAVGHSINILEVPPTSSTRSSSTPR